MKKRLFFKVFLDKYFRARICNQIIIFDSNSDCLIGDIYPGFYCENHTWKEYALTIPHIVDIESEKVARPMGIIFLRKNYYIFLCSVTRNESKHLELQIHSISHNILIFCERSLGNESIFSNFFDMHY